MPLPLNLVGAVQLRQGLIHALSAPFDVLQSTVHQNLSFSNQNDAAGHHFNILHVMSSQYHSCTMVFVEIFHKITNRQLGNRIQTYGRLIQEQNSRTMQQ